MRGGLVARDREALVQRDDEVKPEETSDEATGLPPLADVESEVTLLVLAWTASEGVVQTPDDKIVAVRYLSVRGLMTSGDPTDVAWAQCHLAVPVKDALNVAAALAKGTTEELG